MKYTMYHKTVPTITFSINEQGYVNQIFSVQNIMHIHPYFLENGKLNSKDNYYSLLDKLTRWMEKRNIPASRKNLSSALSLLGVKSTGELSEKSFFMSLSDQYWIAPTSTKLDWNKINFFTNNFSEDVGKALFGKLITTKKINLHSPDSNTDGYLVKKWLIKNGKRVLIKGGSGTEQLEPFNEVLASEIYNRLGIEHAHYELFIENRKHFSKCEDLINQNTELISAEDICEDLLNWKDGSVSYDKFKERCKLLNVKFDEEKLAKMFIIDYLIANEDRHLNNFGFIRNADTLEWIGLAPIYDSGNSMFNKLNDFEIDNEIGLCEKNLQCKPFSNSFAQQLYMVSFKKYLSKLDLNKLNDIGEYYKNLLNQNERNISTDKIEKLSNALQNRVELLKEFQKTRSIEDFETVKNFKKNLKNLTILTLSNIKECYLKATNEKNKNREIMSFYFAKLGIENERDFIPKLENNIRKTNKLPKYTPPEL